MPPRFLQAALAAVLVLPSSARAQTAIDWSAGPALAIPRDHHAVFTVDRGEQRWLYVAGGTNYRDMFDDVSRAEIRADGSLGEWQLTTALPTPRAGLAAIAVGDVVVATGGQIQGPDRRLPRIDEVFTARVQNDGSLGAWHAAPALPSPRFHHPLVAHGDWVYIVGGQGAREAEPEVFGARVQNGTIGEWVALTPLPRARSHHAVNVIDGHVYVFGGLDGAPGRPQAGFFDVIRAPIQADGTLGAWETVSMIPHSYATHSVSVHGGAAWLLGGVEDMQRFVANVWRAPLDPEDGLGAWTAVEPGLPAARGHVHVTPVVNGRIYSIGGRLTSGVTGDVQIGTFR